MEKSDSSTAIRFAIARTRAGCILKISSVARSGAAATAHVLVTWEGTPDRRDIKLELVRTPSGWRVADIGTSDDPSLLRALEKSNREQRRNKH